MKYICMYISHIHIYQGGLQMVLSSLTTLTNLRGAASWCVFVRLETGGERMHALDSRNSRREKTKISDKVNDNPDNIHNNTTYYLSRSLNKEDFFWGKN